MNGQDNGASFVFNNNCFFAVVVSAHVSGPFRVIQLLFE
jgi:hypothetical protein